MSTEINVVLGLGIVAALFAFFTFEFLSRTREQNGEGVGNDALDWMKTLGILCFFISIIFIDMIVYTLLLIAQNTGLSYLSDTILTVALQVIMWSTIISIALYLFFLTLNSLRFLHESVMTWWHGRSKGDD